MVENDFTEYAFEYCGCGWIRNLNANFESNLQIQAMGIGNHNSLVWSRK